MCHLKDDYRVKVEQKSTQNCKDYVQWYNRHKFHIWAIKVSPICSNEKVVDHDKLCHLVPWFGLMSTLGGEAVEQVMMGVAPCVKLYFGDL